MVRGGERGRGGHDEVQYGGLGRLHVCTHAMRGGGIRGDMGRACLQPATIAQNSKPIKYSVVAGVMELTSTVEKCMFTGCTDTEECSTES